MERHGNEDWKASLAFLKELTKRFTGEYAIRPLLKEHPQEVMKELIDWSKDPNVHVRRLACEGVRIRLPWSEKIYVALDEFDAVIVVDADEATYPGLLGKQQLFVAATRAMHALYFLQRE